MIRRNIPLVIASVLLIGASARGQQSPQENERRRVTLQAYYQAVLDRWILSPVGGAWWTNASLVAKLGLTDDQKAKIERVFENHRATLEASKTQLEKEEAALARLLEAESFDRNAGQAQTYRVIQARSDMERANALMTLDMREVLTRAQWMQLPQPSWSVSYEVRGGRGPRGQQ